LDLDHFKRVNDAKGHLAGDEVLRQFAGILRETSREGEMLARYGGEEFAVLIPNVDAAGALWAGERFRRAIEQARWGGIGITVSVGVATLRAGDITEDDLVSLADIGLYAAKDSGRNRVCAGNFPLATAL
jgi:diguanylate cyclase (GGDEF)-like protein